MKLTIKIMPTSGFVVVAAGVLRNARGGSYRRPGNCTTRSPLPALGAVEVAA